MSTDAIVLQTPAPAARPSLVAWGMALALALTLELAALEASIPPIVAAAAILFLFLAVASDVRSQRVPNWLTLPCFVGALAAAPWLGAPGGLAAAALGGALGLALLVGPYAAGGVGAGDVKALMVLGAWLGAQAAVEVAAWAVGVTAVFGLGLLAWRGELAHFARRWGRIALTTWTLRRLAYEAPAPGSAAAGGLPFAVALALGVAAHWCWGAPW